MDGPGLLAKTIAALLVAALVAGCAIFSRIEPGDTADSVIDRFGHPDTIWENPDGSEVWQFPQGFYATETFMVTIGPDRKVKGVHQALSEPFLSQIQPGMTKDDVHRILGRPREIWRFPSRNNETWTWRYRDTNFMLFHVLFDTRTGKVTRTQRLQEITFPDRGGRRR